jgi:hypothetical protein
MLIEFVNEFLEGCEETSMTHMDVMQAVKVTVSVCQMLIYFGTGMLEKAMSNACKRPHVIPTEEEIQHSVACLIGMFLEFAVFWELWC